MDRHLGFAEGDFSPQSIRSKKSGLKIEKEMDFYVSGSYIPFHRFRILPRY
jgi:hypothetical protein